MTKPSSRRSFLTKGALAGILGSASISGFGKELETAITRSSIQSRPSDLKISDIKCGYIRGGHSLFVKIHTNQGIWGCGEGVDATPGTYHLVKMFGQRLKDKNPLNVNRLFEDIRRSGFFEGAQSGMYVAVLSAVESALWDLAGKALGLPVYQLLGGKFRDRIRLYMDTALYQSSLPDPQKFAESSLEAVKMGFTAVKFDLDQANDPNKYDRYNWTASPGEIQRMHDQIAAQGIIVEEVPLKLICFVTKGQHEVIESVGGENAHDVPNDRPAAYLDQFFLGQSLAAHPRPLSSTQYYDRNITH